MGPSLEKIELVSMLAGNKYEQVRRCRDTAAIMSLVGSVLELIVTKRKCSLLTLSRPPSTAAKSAAKVERTENGRGHGRW